MRLCRSRLHAARRRRLLGVALVFCVLLAVLPLANCASSGPTAPAPSPEEATRELANYEYLLGAVWKRLRIAGVDEPLVEVHEFDIEGWRWFLRLSGRREQSDDWSTVVARSELLSEGVQSLIGGLAWSARFSFEMLEGVDQYLPLTNREGATPWDRARLSGAGPGGPQDADWAVLNGMRQVLSEVADVPDAARGNGMTKFPLVNRFDGSVLVAASRDRTAQYAFVAKTASGRWLLIEPHKLRATETELHGSVADVELTGRVTVELLRARSGDRLFPVLPRSLVVLVAPAPDPTGPTFLWARTVAVGEDGVAVVEGVPRGGRVYCLATETPLEDETRRRLEAEFPDLVDGFGLPHLGLSHREAARFLTCIHDGESRRVQLYLAPARSRPASAQEQARDDELRRRSVPGFMPPDE